MVNFTKGKTPEECFLQFQNHFQCLFEFGEKDKESFLSGGVMESFLVKLHKAGDSGMNESRNPESLYYREDIEFRAPGFVSAIEYYPKGINFGNPITILEEERLFENKLQDVANRNNYYKNRLIHVFMKPGIEMVENRKACEMFQSIRSKMNDSIKPPVDLRIKCVKEKCITDKDAVFHLNQKRGVIPCKCNEKLDYEGSADNMDNIIPLASSSYAEGQKMILRRYANVVSNPNILHNNQILLNHRSFISKIQL